MALLLRRRLRVKRIKPARLVILVFFAIIMLGAVLLTLPVASRDGESVGFLNALFTATSATCVTGLVVVDTYTQFTVFGQVVVIALIQIGGIGFMTVLTIFSMLLRRRIGLRERMTIATAFGLDELDGIVRLVKHVIVGTIFFETAGALLLMTRFVPLFGLWGGIGRSFFTSISAFCNAGFDLMGSIQPFSSLTYFAGDVVVNLTVMALIVIGGLGFLVWEDIWRNRRWRKLSVYSKLMISGTGLLIIGGAAIFFAAEYGNPQTMGSMNFGESVLASLFQSVTPRTAGFNTISQAGMTDTSKYLTVILMLIGGGSGSTAGGAKVVTVSILFLAAFAAARGSNEVRVMKRRISQRQVSNALSVMLLFLLLTISTGMLISIVEDVPILDSLLETTSAMCTVGLSTGITPGLSVLSQIILIVLMFFGRVGIMTIALAFFFEGKDNGEVRYPECKVLVG